MSTITIASNVASLDAQRRLSQSTAALEGTFHRLSSGLRINRASDDAAGLAIASDLNADKRVFTQGIRNLNDGVALLNVAEGALSELGNVATRISELAEQSKNGTVTLVQRRALNQEANALVKEYNRITGSTKFNDLSLLDRSITSLTVQSGYGTNGQISLALDSNIDRAVGDGTFQAVQSLNLALYDQVTFSNSGPDLKMDLISSDFAGGTISVQLGNGDGTFLARVSFAFNGSPGLIASMDVNSDGSEDLVVQDANLNTLSVLLSNGNGTYRLGVSFSSDQAVALEQGDFNNDGRNDLLLIGSSSVEQVFLNNGNGTFKAPLRIDTVDNFAATNLDIEDFDGDGNQDIALTHNSTSAAKLFFGNGNGSFNTGVTQTSATGISNIAMADFNGDGICEMIYEDGAQNILMKLGQAGRTFAAPTTLVSGNISALPAAGDFNGDGIADLLYSNTAVTSQMNVRFGNGDGTFGAVKTVVNQSAGLQVGLVLDFSGDGVMDIGGVDFNNGIAYLMLGNSNSVTTLAAVNLLTATSAGEQLDYFRGVLDNINRERGAIGAFQSRLSTGISNLHTNTENLATSESRIRDADIAEESVVLVKGQILQQAGIAVLSQANALPQLALTLLRG